MIFLRTGFGLGDILLSSGILRAVKRIHPQEHIFIETRLPEIFTNNPNVWHAVRDGKIVYAIQKLFGYPYVWRWGNIFLKNYDKIFKKIPYPFPCRDRHLIDAMADSLGIKLLSDEKQPILYLSKQEIDTNKWAKNSIVVQSSSTNYWTVNKHWIPGRMQKVVNELYKNHKIVHIGSINDERLENVIDLRGKTTIREAAAIIFNSRLFVGLEGGLVHLAKAVDKKSIVIYTGYTKPTETGYSSNINLRDSRAGDGCWKRERCFDCSKYSRNVKVNQVINCIEKEFDNSIK